MKKIPHIKVKKKQAQQLIEIIKKKFKDKSLLSSKYKVIEKEEFLFFPLKTQEDADELLNLLECTFPIKIKKIKAVRDLNYSPRSLEEALKPHLSTKLYDLIPQSYDVIGNIAIVSLEQYDSIKNPKKIKKRIANGIITINKNIKAVYEEISKVRGIYRLRKLLHLAGKDDTHTIHRENHCIYMLDLNKVFFSPRLNHERRRISSLKIERGELIVDLFAGVGSFSILIAKKKKVSIYAFDINPSAIKFLKKNIELNNLKGTIFPHKMDVKNLLNSKNEPGIFLKNKVDRILMNLPEKSRDYLDVVCHLAKRNGCIVHNYQFNKKPDSVKKAIEKLQKELHKFNYRIDNIENARIVKSYSPKSDMVVIDALIKRITNS
jgi:tRNA (guanine37-N1)-methyltransferase